MQDHELVVKIFSQFNTVVDGILTYFRKIRGHEDNVILLLCHRLLNY